MTPLPYHYRRGPPKRRAEHNAQPEHDLQRACKDFLAYALFETGVAYTAVDHARKQSIQAGAKQRARGIRAGQADWRFVLPPHGRSAEIELKIGHNKQSPEQVQWEREIVGAGGLYAVCYDLHAMAATLTKWGVRLRVGVTPRNGVSKLPT